MTAGLLLRRTTLPVVSSNLPGLPKIVPLTESSAVLCRCSAPRPFVSGLAMARCLRTAVDSAPLTGALELSPSLQSGLRSEFRASDAVNPNYPSGQSLQAPAPYKHYERIISFQGQAKQPAKKTPSQSDLFLRRVCPS